MLAISAMSATVQAIFYLLAVVCFVLAGLSMNPGKKNMNLMAFGLAFFVFVFMWNAFAAAG